MKNIQVIGLGFIIIVYSSCAAGIAPTTTQNYSNSGTGTTPNTGTNTSPYPANVNGKAGVPASESTINRHGIGK